MEFPLLKFFLKEGLGEPVLQHVEDHINLNLFECKYPSLRVQVPYLQILSRIETCITNYYPKPKYLIIGSFVSPQPDSPSPKP